MTETITAITDGQKKQIRRFAEDAVEQVLKTLDKDGAQRLIERGNEFQERIDAAAAELSAGDQFADEETESSYGYLSGYKPKGIAEQVARLRELFPELKDATFDESIATRPLPPAVNRNLAIGFLILLTLWLFPATGGVAIPKGSLWDKIARGSGYTVRPLFLF